MCSVVTVTYPISDAAYAQEFNATGAGLLCIGTTDELTLAASINHTVAAASLHAVAKNKSGLNLPLAVWPNGH